MVKETKKRKRGPDDEAIEHSVKTERATMKSAQQICSANYEKAAERVLQRRMRTGEKIVKLAVKHCTASENYVENVSAQLHQHSVSLDKADRALQKIEREIIKGKEALKLFGERLKDVTSYVTKVNKEAKKECEALMQQQK
jgi:hypothetical protein